MWLRMDDPLATVPLCRGFGMFQRRRRGEPGDPRDGTEGAGWRHNRTYSYHVGRSKQIEGASFMSRANEGARLEEDL